MKFDKGQYMHEHWIFNGPELYDAQTAVVTETKFKYDVQQVALWCKENLKHHFHFVTQRQNMSSVELDEVNNNALIEEEYSRLILLQAWIADKGDAAVFKLTWC